MSGFRLNLFGRAQGGAKVPASTHSLNSAGSRIPPSRHTRGLKGTAAREFYSSIPPVSMALERWWRPALSAETMVVLKESPVSGDPPVEHNLPDISAILMTPNGFERPDSMWMRSTTNYFFDGITAYLAFRDVAPPFSLQQEEQGILDPAPAESFALVDGAAIVGDCLVATSHVTGKTHYVDREPTLAELSRAGGRPLSYQIATAGGGSFRVPARDLGIYAYEVGQPVGCWGSPLCPYTPIGDANLSIHERELGLINTDVSTIKRVELDGGVGSSEEMYDAVEDIQGGYGGPQNAGRAIPGELVRTITDVNVRPLEFKDNARASREELLGAMCIPSPLFNNISSQYANGQTGWLQMQANARHKMSGYGQALTGILLTPEQRKSGIFIGPRSLTQPDTVVDEATPGDTVS